MKKLIILLTMVVFASMAKSQSTPGELLANHIALKMKDSLILTTQQKDSIYMANLLLHAQKMQVWQQYSSSDSLGFFIQEVENMRDSIYRTILPAEKYLLYKPKKKSLVSNN